MARERIIEGTWKCGQCDTADIPGSKKVCPTCASPREDDEAKFDFGKDDASGKSDRATVEDAAALQLAAAGADWYCAYCGSANVGTAEKCKVCSSTDASARLAKKPEKLKEAGHPPPVPPPPAPAGGSGLKAAGGVMGCGGLAIFLGLSAVCLGSVWFVFGRTSSEDGKVASLHWSADVQVDTFEKMNKTGFKGDAPTGAPKMPVAGKGENRGSENFQACVTKEKSPKKCEMVTKKEQCGTEEKCTKKDLGNGFAKEICDDVPKYCENKVAECTEAVSDEWCSYDTWDWKAKANQHAEGNDNKVVWPSVPVGALDREVRTGKFEVNVSFGKETGVFEAPDAADFARFSPGQTVIVSQNLIGTITDVEPKK